MLSHLKWGVPILETVPSAEAARGASCFLPDSTWAIKKPNRWNGVPKQERFWKRTTSSVAWGPVIAANHVLAVPYRYPTRPLGRENNTIPSGFDLTFACFQVLFVRKHRGYSSRFPLFSALCKACKTVFYPLPGKKSPSQPHRHAPRTPGARRIGKYP